MIVPNALLLAEVSSLLDEGKEVELMTKGFSMLPFIVGNHDSVRLRKEEAGPGDAVLAEVTPGHYVLHRIVSSTPDRVVLKGDGNLCGTETCRPQDIKGRVVAVLKRKGKIIDCNTETYRRRVRLWNSEPYIVRRVWLAVLRRTICR